jgi:hypothetical protein
MLNHNGSYLLEVMVEKKTMYSLWYLRDAV